MVCVYLVNNGCVTVDIITSTLLVNVHQTLLEQVYSNQRVVSTKLSSQCHPNTFSGWLFLDTSEARYVYIIVYA